MAKNGTAMRALKNKKQEKVIVPEVFHAINVPEDKVHVVANAFRAFLQCTTVAPKSIKEMYAANGLLQKLKSLTVPIVDEDEPEKSGIEFKAGTIELSQSELDYLAAVISPPATIWMNAGVEQFMGICDLFGINQEEAEDDE